MPGLQYSDVVANQQGVSPDNLAAQANLATAPVPATQANPKGASGTQTPPVITPESMATTPPLTIPQTDNSTTAADGLVAGANTTSTNLQNTINSLTPAPTIADNQNQSILDSIASLTGDDANKGADTLAMQQVQGVQGKQQALTDANNELATKTAKYAQLQSSLGGNNSVETSGVLAAQNAGLLKAQAADIGITQAKITAAQGNLSLANQQVTDAINLKYSTIENQISVKQAQLAALAPTLSKEEKVQALAQQKVLADQAQAVADKKADEQANLTIALQSGANTKFVNNNGKFFNTATGESYATPADFFKAAGVTSFDQAYQQGLISDYTPAKAADYNLVQQMAAKYPDAGIKSSDTTQQAQAKLQSSAIYRKDTYIAPPAGSTAAGLNISPALASAINAGTIDPNKINSRTLGIYESIAQAGVDAVGSHAGAVGETAAVSNLVQYKSTATRTLGVIDKNLPLVASLADKVNQTGVPGLDQYIQGVKSYTGNDQDVVKYVNSLKTLRSEYAQMLAKGNSATDSDKSEAAQAIPAGLSGDAYTALGDQLKLEANNILQASDDAINSAKNSNSSNNNTSNSNQTVESNGQTYNVGQVYNDGTANWIVDAKGNWTKQ